MSNDFWSTLNKKKKEELLKSTQTKSSSAAYEEIKTSDFFSALNEDKKREFLSKLATESAPTRTFMQDDDDIAPVKGGNKNSVFKSGGFSDGVDGVGDFFLDLGETVAGTMGDVGTSILKGVGRLAEGVVDLGTYGVAGVADLVGADKFAEKTKKAAQYNVTDKLTKGLTDYFDPYSVLGDKADAVGESLGQVVGLIGTAGLGASAGLGKVGIAALNKTLLGTSTMGSSMGEAYAMGKSDIEATSFGFVEGVKEVIFESLFDGMGKAAGLGKGITSVDDALAKKMSSVAAKFITSEAGQKYVGNTLEWAVKSGAEGLEEVLSGFGSAIAKDAILLNGEDEKAFGEILKDENLLEQFVVGSIVSGIAQGGDFISSTKNGRDFVSGLSKNEQTVVDKVYNDAIAKRETDGKKLTNKEKNEIYDSIIEKMDKGYIDIDTIEGVLGGDEYKAYKDNLDTTENLKKELEDLSIIEKGKLNRKQEKRIEELEAMNLDDTTKLDELRKKLDDKLSPMLENSRLVESYNEKARRRQAFEADLTKYTGKQRAAVERAIKSGVLNNTNRSHELVDILSKIEADKGIAFDYTNNAKLKESGFAVEGKTVNGFVKDGGVTLNVQSAKAWQSTVGHEITHVLEGTEAYGALREALYAYAESKGELESRKTALTELYNGMNADIDAELTADLVGDYLFTDKDFINKLTGNRTLFQKVWDEVKYLCKVATGKELTEIEKVEREFAKAWKERGQIAQNEEYSETDDSGEGDVNYSISVTDKSTRDFLDEQVSRGEYDAETNPDVRYSLSSMANTFFGDEKMTSVAFEESNYKETDGYKNYVEQCINNMRQTRTDFDESVARREIEEQIDGIVRVALAAKKAGYDIYDDATKRSKKDSKKRLLFSSLEPNSDYFTSSDISTECDKRKNFADIYDAIVRKEEAMGVPQGKRFFDNVDNYFYLHKVLADKGLTQPCRECYVESMRKNLAPMANAFLRLVNETDVNNKANDQLYHQDGKLKSNNSKLRNKVLKAFEANPEYNMTASDLTIEMLTTEKGLAQLKIQAPLIYEAFNSFYGQSKPKMPKAATPFRFGELTALLTDHNGKINRKLVEKINSTGGFRLQSYSDFQIENFTDVLQVIYEAGTLGLSGHAYTKVPAFLKATEGTNLKRNISIFMYKDGDEWKLDKNDSFPYELEEIYDIVNSDASGNTGIIAVSQNKDMSCWIMANDFIGYGIPFHKSGLKMDTVRDTDVQTDDGRIVKGYSETIDHTKQQTEVYADTETKVKKGINIYSFWDFNNVDNLSKNELIEKNVREYIKRCETAGYLPKFRDYVINNDSVLNDVLRYAKELGFVEQTATIDDISFKYEGKYHSYTIPYGYYKFLGDFNMFKPDGTASPHDTLSLDGYDFDAAERFFADAEGLRRNEILQQFANGAERQKYRDSDMDAEELTKIVEQKREEAAESIVAPVKASLSDEGEQFAPIGNYSTPLNATALGQDIAPVADGVVENATADAPMPDEIVPMTEEEANALQDEKANADAKLEGDPKSRKQLHSQILDKIKSTFRSKGYEFDDVLRNAKNLSTFSTVDNTPQRVMEKALGYKEGQALADLTVNKVAQNETEGIKWLNSFTDRKNGLLAQISKQYNIKPGSKESAAAQMYAEGFYVNENNDIVAYGDAELEADFPDARVRSNIKGLATDTRIRQIYDETLDAINRSRTRNAYPEIQKLDNYFLHFRAMEDTFSKLGLPFNPNDIKAKDLPTDLNGVTADLKPGQPYFASAMHRKGKRTSFDLLGGLERYLTSAKNQIYHIDDIQTLRALRNYIADNYGQAHGLEGIDTLTEEEAQAKIEQVYGSHLSTFAKFLNEEANVLAGKTALIDRGLEGIIGRRGITFLDTLNKQVGSNMVGYSASSAIVNFDAIPRAVAKSNKYDFLKAFAQTVSNKFSSTFGKGDNFAENSPVIIRRKGAERFYRTPFQKTADAGYVLMGAIDNISTEIIARTKFNELTRKGMSEQQAHFETDKWVSRLMGDRSLGQMPQLYNSKMLGLITKFQLEVRNNLDSQFYDTIQEAKVSNEEIENRLARNAKTAAKITSTFVQLAVAQHLFGKVFESIAGYNPSFDIISTLATMFGFDDDEESEDTVLDNIEQGFLELLEDLPYTSTFTGGRIPISSALPIKEFVTGKDSYGNEKSRVETLLDVAPYYLLPGGYGQIKKTAQGLNMFSDDHPIAGSYTDSGNLRFPVEDTPLNRIQAGIFGQYASKNAREYFDNDYAPLKEKQIQEYMDVDLPIGDYWKYREGLKGLKTQAEKADYINSLDIKDWQKNLLMNNILDRKEDVDMSNYDDYSDWEEFDYAQKNPDKYAFAKSVGGYSAYKTYSDELYDIKADKDEYGKSISGSRKEKVLNYINNLDADYETKIILWKSEYPSDDTYNMDIINYLNNRADLTYEERVTILKELGFTVSGDTVYWD